MKLQNCHGNSSCISISAKMASRFLKMVTFEEVTELEEAAGNLNARKSTINWVRVFEKLCDENSLEKNMEMILLVSKRRPKTSASSNTSRLFPSYTIFLAPLSFSRSLYPCLSPYHSISIPSLIILWHQSVAIFLRGDQSSLTRTNLT